MTYVKNHLFLWLSLKMENLPYLLYFAEQIIFGEDADERISEAKVENFVEDIVPSFNDMQFKRHFRLDPFTFENLLQKVHSIIPRELRKGHPQLSIEKQVLLGIWYLANIECFRSVAQRFGVTKSTAWAVLQRFGQWLLQVNREFKIIWWPSPERSREISASFENINGFPGIIGCIDGSHIRILAPIENPNSYINRKKFHSVLLQGVCDNRKLFIDVFTGLPGCCHDSRLFQMSDIFERIENNLIDFPNDGHLIGDLAYPLTRTMMVGFKDYGNLTDGQRNFNVKLSQIRVLIEQTFALLKGRFRRLKFMETVRLDLISLNIIAGCIVHNICVLNGDNPDEILDLEEELDEERLRQGAEEPHGGNNRNRRDAVIKRNRIMDLL